MQQTNQIEQPKTEIQKPIEKNSIVSTPQGEGEVKAISNGQAIVEIDGKAHKIDEKELEPSIFSDDDVAKAYDHLMAIIPEPHRSGFISWSGYDENRNVLGFIPRGGKYEELHNITPEEAKLIKEGKGVARTTGENKEGLWVKGEDTRGGIISQIIWDRREKAEAEEKAKHPEGWKPPKKEKEDKGMKPIFDEMKYAREKSQEREKALKLAAKEKEKAKKLAEKERIKKEKDEEKARKRKK